LIQEHQHPLRIDAFNRQAGGIRKPVRAVTIDLDGRYRRKQLLFEAVA